MLNWRKDFPAIRTALGLLGRQGYTSMFVARFLRTHEVLAKVRKTCESLGRDLNDETIQSRLKRPEELEWIEKNDPDNYRRGKRLATSLKADLDKAGIASYGHIG
jgi:hypothetical protein